MKLFKTIFLSLFTVLFTFQSQAQRAKDGNYTASTANDVVNTYTNVTGSISAGAMSINVANNAMGGAHFAGNLAAGDLIMIYQAYGVDVNIDIGMYVFNFTNPATIANGYLWSGDWDQHLEEFGEITNYHPGVGKFERVEVAGTSGSTTINLQCGTKNAYDVTKRVQIIRIPRYDNLTVNAASSIVPTAWNGTTGGIVAIEVNTALTVNATGSISANGLGFRGGQLDGNGQSGDPSSPNQWRFLGVDRPEEGSEHGEGIYGYHIEYDAIYSRYGIGAIANAGGGGGYQNAGGGGGANIQAVTAGFSGNGVPNPAYNTAWALDISGLPGTARTPINGTSTPGGGRGGYALAQTDLNELAVGPRNSGWGGDARKTNGGLGGHPLTYDANRLFFGGGGGAGDQDGLQGGAGGAGGGIVYIVNYGTTSGAGTISANGANGQNSNPGNLNATISNTRRGNDGAGGGGAGGAIYIENATALPATINLNARGGNGGNQNIRLYYNPPISTPDEAGGPGGSGAGGSIAYSSGTPTLSVIAGTNGVVNSERGTAGGGYSPTPSPMVGNFPPNGATNGAVGMSNSGAPYYDLQISDVTTCTTPITLTVTILGAIPGDPTGATINWYTQQFGGTSVNTGTTYSVSPAVTTTYYVGVCPSPTSFRVPVTVTISSPTLTITNPAPICAPATADLTAAAVTAGSDAGTLTYWTDAGATTPYGTPTAATAGTYYIQLDVTGCTVVEPVVVSNASAPNLVITNPAAVCSPNTVDLTAAAVTAGSDAGTLTYWTDAGATSAYGTPGAATNGTYYIQLDGGGCTNIQAVTATVSPLDNAGFTMTPTCDGGTATITGLAGGTFSFNVAPIDAAVINASTGVVSGGTTGSSYSVLYTTAGTCPNSSVVSVTAATNLSYTVVLSPENCGAGDGSIVLTAANGDGGPYQYSITGAAPYSGSGTFTGLTAGNFNISILDNSGCEVTGSESVTSIGGPSIDNVAVTQPSCAGACDGSVTLTVTGGTAPYTYAWTDNLGNPVGTNSPTLSGQCAGVYNVEVTDAVGGTTTLYDEDFNSGTGGWTLNVPTGAEGADPNFFVVNDNEGGVLPPGCGIATNGDATLHITSVFFSAGGAAYDAGGLCGFLFCPQTNRRAESPIISTVGQSGLTLTFDFIANGDGVNDQGTVWYNDGFGWTQLGAGLSSPVCGSGQGQWTAYSAALPASCENIANLQIAIKWENNDDGVGTDPSIAINNIEVTAAATAGCPAFANATLTNPAALNLTITNPAAVCAPGTVDLTVAAVTAGSDAGTLTYWTDAGATIAYGTPTAATAGTYYIQLTSGACSVIEAVTVTTTPAPATPTIAAGGPVTFCTGGSVVLTSSSATGNQWLLNGAPIGGATGQTHTASTAGDYTVIVTSGGCPSAASAVTTVTINPIPATPTIAAGSATTFCAGGSVTLTSSAATGNQWYLDGNPIGGATGQTHVASTAGDYTVIVTTGGCPSAASSATTVTVNPIPATPTIAAGGPISFCTGGSVTLTSSAAAGNQWYLDGNPIAGATGQTHVASTAGDYTVIVTTGGCPSAASAATTVTITPAPATPTITAGGPTAFCTGGSVTLTSSAAAGNQWYLDGNPIAGATGQTHSATVAGDYTVIVTTGCPSAASAITTVTVFTSPVISVGTVTSPTTCGTATGSIEVTGAATGTVSWTGTATGNSGVVTLPYVITGLAAGTYNIVLTVSTCTSNTLVQTIADPSGPATPTIAASGPVSFCSPGSVTLTSSSASGNQWSLNGAPIGGATAQTLVVTASGDYTVTVTAGGCASAPSAVTTVTVNSTPAVTVSNDGPICIGGTFNLNETGGDAASWAWSSSGSATITAATDQSPSVTGAVDGEVFTVVVTAANMCTNTANTTISVIQSPVLDPIADVINCGPYTLPAIQGTNLTSTEAYYDNSVMSGGMPITGPITTTQTVWVYDGIATCEDEISFLVTINPLPTVVSFTGGANYCDAAVPADIMVDVTGSPDWTIDYTLDGVPQTITSTTSPVSLGNGEGVYVLTNLTDANCTSVISGTQTITVTATPAQPVAGDDVTYCADDTPVAIFVTGNGGTYTWYTDNTMSTVYWVGSSLNPMLTTQTYYVTESLNGCESTPDDVVVTFENCEVIYPTAFTPDGDGTNDTWEIVGLDEKYPDNTVRIYNRWGNLIFEHQSSSLNPYNNNQWDGTYKGAPLPVGSFYYIIDLNGKSDEKAKGTVSIILN